MAKYVTGPAVAIREAVRSITHIQSTPAVNWDITHDYVDQDSISVQCTDSDGIVTEPYDIDTEYGANTVRVTWSSSTTGKVKLKGV